MGKKRAQVRQVRQQMRKVQPKAAPPASAGQTRKQRERFVQAGGMLQGYAPDFVIRMGYAAVKALVDKLNGKTPERRIDTGATVVTAANLKEPAVQELLNPPIEKYLK